MIAINNLSKSFGDKNVLNNIHLSIKKGTVCGIIGKNGAGKTTLFKCIAGLESHEGNITFNEGLIKSTLGYLETETFFFKKISGLEYILMLTKARNIDLTTQQILEKNIFQLPLDKEAFNYSTGMKKKLALTAVLLQNNECFIFDEPFNGVDLESNQMILEIIQHLKSTNKTIIISSHILSTLTDSCDIIYLLDKGQLSEKYTKENFHLIEQQLQSTTLKQSLQQFFQ